MRLVLDTNTLVSGFLWGGNPARLIDAASAGQMVIITSLSLLAELEEVLSRPKFRKAFAKANLHHQRWSKCIEGLP